MDQFEALSRMALALVVGLTVGLERGWSGRNAHEGSRVAGLRTFTLLGLLGGICGLLAATGERVLGFGLLGAALVVAAGHLVVGPTERVFGITTAVAAVLTFALGALAATGHGVAALAAAVAAALILDLKPALHGLLRRLEQREVRAALQFVLVTSVVLPLLPDRGFGPEGALNPREIGFMVVLVAGISFLGYAAMRVVGARKGVLLTALFGGLVSSTAVTVALARTDRIRSDEELPVAFGIVLASMIMVLRVGVLVFTIEKAMLRPLLLPLGLVLLAAAVAVVVLYRRPGGRPIEGGLVMNPLDLRAALQFGALLAGVVVLVPLVRSWLGEAGLLALAALSGVTDVDAITLTLARLGADPNLRATGAAGVALAVAANMLTKAALAAALGGPQARRRAVPALAGLAICAAAGLLFLV